MSAVNNYVLKVSPSGQSEQLVLYLNDMMSGSTSEAGPKFLRVDQHAGGTRAMEIGIYLLAGNYIAPELVVEVLQEAIARIRKGSTLVLPNSIQLFCQLDGDPDGKGLQCVFSGAASV